MTSRLFPLLLLVAIGCGSGSGVEVADTALADIAIADTALPEDTFSPRRAYERNDTNSIFDMLCCGVWSWGCPQWARRSADL